MRVEITPAQVELVPPVRGEGFWKRLVTPQKFRLLNDVVADIGDWHHVIKAGLVTDFASIPRLLKPIFPDAINYGTAALLHDNLYLTGIMGKRICDAVLAGLIVDLDEGEEWQAELVFLCVHLFGFVAWRKHRRVDAG